MKSSYPERLVINTDQWDQGFADHIQRYKFVESLCSGNSLLDCACGIGYGSYYLAKHGAKKVYAIDISREAIDQAKQLYSYPNIDFQVDDCETLSTVTSTFDVIVGLECIEHLKKPEKFLNRCTQIMNDQSVLILSTPNADSSGKILNKNKPVNPYHIREFTYDEFYNFLHLFFNEVEIFFQIKTRQRLLYEDTYRFVQFAYKYSPILKLASFFRKLLKRSGSDPVIRKLNPIEADYEIVSENIDVFDSSCFVYVAVCRRPITKTNLIMENLP